MMLELTTTDGVAQAWLARPEAGGRHPGVLMFMDAIGLRPRIYDMADRISSWGYVVLAPNVFYRNGVAADLAPAEPLLTDELRGEFFAKAMPRVAALTPAKAERDIAAYVSGLTGLDDVTAPIGVVGYCMGARLALRAAGWHPDVVAACACFHGGGLATTKDDSPHLGLTTARAEFLFGHADRDRSMGPTDIARLAETLDAAGLRATNQVYPGAAHGYSMADTATYDEAAAERHFEELRALLARTLG